MLIIPEKGRFDTRSSDFCKDRFSVPFAPPLSFSASSAPPCLCICLSPSPHTACGCAFFALPRLAFESAFSLRPALPVGVLFMLCLALPVCPPFPSASLCLCVRFLLRLALPCLCVCLSPPRRSACVSAFPLRFALPVCPFFCPAPHVSPRPPLAAGGAGFLPCPRPKEGSCAQTLKKNVDNCSFSVYNRMVVHKIKKVIHIKNVKTQDFC